MDRVVVTGAGGFVGYHLAKRLLEQECHVIGIGQRETDLVKRLKRFQKFDFRLADLRIAEQVEQALLEPVEVVYHLAGQPAVWFANAHPGEDLEANIKGTVNILERMRAIGGGRLVFSSTGEVYNSACGTEEDSPLEPANFYGLSKLMAEHYIKLYSKLFSLRYTILRFSLIYGPYFNRNVVFDIIRGLTKGDEVVLRTSIDSAYDLLFIDDALGAVLQASCKQWDNQVVNISQGSATPVKDILEASASILDIERKAKVNIVENETVNKVYTNGRALELGWQPVYSFEDGLKRTIEWWITGNGN